MYLLSGLYHLLKLKPSLIVKLLILGFVFWVFIIAFGGIYQTQLLSSKGEETTGVITKHEVSSCYISSQCQHTENVFTTEKGKLVTVRSDIQPGNESYVENQEIQVLYLKDSPHVAAIKNTQKSALTFWTAFSLIGVVLLFFVIRNPFNTYKSIYDVLLNLQSKNTGSSKVGLIGFLISSVVVLLYTIQSRDLGGFFWLPFFILGALFYLSFGKFYKVKPHFIILASLLNIVYVIILLARTFVYME